MAEWLFPVAGENTWNPGSWMPNTPREHQEGRTHPAIDIFASAGTPIVAPVSGVVARVGVNTRVGGNWVVVKGDDGIEYYFAHMQDPTHLDKGQRIEGGWVLGRIGDTGSAKGTSPHLHMTMKSGAGAYIDPREWLRTGRAPANIRPYIQQHSQARSNAAYSMSTDPFFNQAVEPPAASDPMREQLRSIVDRVSSAVAGGTRMPISKAMQAVGRPSEDEGIEAPEVQKPSSLPQSKPATVKPEVE